MNKIILSGRLTKDPTVEYTKKEKVYTRISIAVDRPYFPGKEKQADFFDCVAFGKTAEMIGNYFQKGKSILLEGSLQFNEYTNKFGQKARSASVLIEHVEFVPRAKKSADKPNAAASEGFGEAFGSEVPDDIENIDF
jgi:single-strand DNA-binding protein